MMKISRYVPDTELDARRTAVQSLAWNLDTGPQARVGTACRIVRARETVTEKGRRVWRDCSAIRVELAR